MGTQRFKYPRTPHLPWSPGVGGDDLVVGVPESFLGGPIVVTEKMDGENTTLYSDGMHARSLDSRHHPSRNWIKNFQGSIGHLIPLGFRICGENLFAQHSIRYEELESYFYVFSIWDDNNHCLSWSETGEWCEKLGLARVPTMYTGPWDEQVMRDLTFDLERVEGYVVRTARGFAHSEFSAHVAKWVRKGHVQTDEHWMHSAIQANGLRASEDTQ